MEKLLPAIQAIYGLDCVSPSYEALDFLEIEIFILLKIKAHILSYNNNWNSKNT